MGIRHLLEWAGHPYPRFRSQAPSDADPVTSDTDPVTRDTLQGRTMGAWELSNGPGPRSIMAAGLSGCLQGLSTSFQELSTGWD